MCTRGRDLATDLLRRANLALATRFLHRGRRDSNDAPKDRACVRGVVVIEKKSRIGKNLVVVGPSELLLVLPRENIQSRERRAKIEIPRHWVAFRVKAQTGAERTLVQAQTGTPYVDWMGEVYIPPNVTTDRSANFPLSETKTPAALEALR